MFRVALLLVVLAGCAPQSQSRPPDEGCHASTDCPGVDGGVGICASDDNNASCSQSSDCEGSESCEQGKCSVGTPSCGRYSSCPSNFEPRGGQCNAAGDCSRKSCTSDSDCSGHCINGLCFYRKGTCQSG